MKPFSTSPLLPSHLEGVAELERLCFAEPWSQKALALLLQDKNLGVVALDEQGMPIGYGGLLTVLDEGQITNIAVHPEHRKKGVGKAILEKLISESRLRNIRELSLEVRESNLPAKALYLSHGFDIAGVRKGFYRHPTEDGLVMILALDTDTQI
jgi:ribosomal-protein-alanine N-acetyltransferase